MTDVRIERYEDEYRDDWNSFVNKSKNATFMHHRDYMEYHSDRFEDFSLLCYYKNDLLGLLPANVEGETVVSHGGLTFGGLLSNKKMKVPKMMEAFEELQTYLASESISTLEYKCIPQIYHSVPAEEDRYALFRNDATLYRRDVTSVVDITNRPRFQKTRRRTIDDARDAGLEVRRTDDFATYWDILRHNLETKHDESPVHTLEEFELLHKRFPEHIKLYASFDGEEMLGGVVVYESETVARAQYIANTDAGRGVGSLDIVFERLIDDIYSDKRFFDLGISTEDDGTYLNEGLIFFKEGFGARGVVHDFYRLDVSSD